MKLLKQLSVRAPMLWLAAVLLVCLMVVISRSHGGHGYVRASAFEDIAGVGPSPVPTAPTEIATVTSTETPASATATPTYTRTPTNTRTSTITRTSTPTGTRVFSPTRIPTNTRNVPSPVPTAVLCDLNFSDTQPSDWYYGAVQWLVCNSIASGYSDATFRPANNITRAQITKIIVLASNWDLIDPKVPRFSDVPRGALFYEYIETAVAHAAISGYPDDTFRPNGGVTRGELARIVVLARAWTLDRPGAATFVDVPSGSPFFAYIETAVRHRVVSGYTDGTFHPERGATRAQLAKVVQSAFAP